MIDTTTAVASTTTNAASAADAEPLAAPPEREGAPDASRPPAATASAAAAPQSDGMRALDQLRAHAPAAFDHLTAVWPMDAAKNLQSAVGYAAELFAAEPALAQAFGDPALGDNPRLIEAAHHAAVGRRLLTAEDPAAVLAELRPDLSPDAGQAGSGARPSARRAAAEDADAPGARGATEAKLARIEELLSRPDYWSETVQAEVQRLYRDVYGSAPLVGRDGRTY
jgi:hypothetical protein